MVAHSVGSRKLNRVQAPARQVPCADGIRPSKSLTLPLSLLPTAVCCSILSPVPAGASEHARMKTPKRHTLSYMHACIAVHQVLLLTGT